MLVQKFYIVFDKSTVNDIFFLFFFFFRFHVIVKINWFDSQSNMRLSKFGSFPHDVLSHSGRIWPHYLFLGPGSHDPHPNSINCVQHQVFTALIISGNKQARSDFCKTIFFLFIISVFKNTQKGRWESSNVKVYLPTILVIQYNYFRFNFKRFFVWEWNYGY